MRSVEEKARKQNKGRNYYSTFIKMFVRAAMENKSGTMELINHIISVNDLKVETHKVFQFLRNKSKSFKNYVRLNTIDSFFCEKGNDSVGIVLRIMMKRFMMKDFLLHYTSSKNLKK